MLLTIQMLMVRATIAPIKAMLYKASIVLIAILLVLFFY